MSDTAITKNISPNVRLTTFIYALVFVLGFSLVFIIGWGGTATALGQLFGNYKTLIGQISGVIVILFGLATIGLINIPWMNYDTRPGWSPGKRNGMLSSGLMGVFVAAGWSPCIGTTLGAILTLGSARRHPVRPCFCPVVMLLILIGLRVASCACLYWLPERAGCERMIGRENVCRLTLDNSGLWLFKRTDSCQ